MDGQTDRWTEVFTISSSLNGDKNIINLSSAEFAYSLLCVDYDKDNIFSQ